MMLARGRPSGSQQIDIERTLRPYFERTLSASFASKKTGCDIKTVCKYFNKWSNEIRAIEEPDFFARQRKERERITLCYDDLIFQEYHILDDIKSEIKKYREEEKAIPKFFVTSHQDVVKTISNLIEKKCSVTIQPFLDEVIEKKIQEKLDTHVKTS